MTHSRTLTSAVLGVGAFALLLASVVPAEAVNCSSVCNQVRRACNHSAKGAYKAAKIQCDEEREGCKSDCAANADTCVADCLALGGLDCELDCANCEENCDAARELCRVTAKADRDTSRDGCDNLRGLCRDTCEDPIDKGCVSDCKTGERECRADAKQAEVLCKKGCPKENGRKACIRSCRKTNNLDQQACQDTAVLCYAGCAEIVIEP